MIRNWLSRSMTTSGCLTIVFDHFRSVPEVLVITKRSSGKWGEGQGVIFEFHECLVPLKCILEAFGTGVPARKVTVKSVNKSVIKNCWFNIDLNLALDRLRNHLLMDRQEWISHLHQKFRLHWNRTKISKYLCCHFGPWNIWVFVWSFFNPFGIKKLYLYAFAFNFTSIKWNKIVSGKHMIEITFFSRTNCVTAINAIPCSWCHKFTLTFTSVLFWNYFYPYFLEKSPHFVHSVSVTSWN